MMNLKLRRWKISTDKNKNKWNNLFVMFKNIRMKYFRSDVIVQLCHDRKYLKTLKRRIGGEIKIFLSVILSLRFVPLCMFVFLFTFWLFSFDH